MFCFNEWSANVAKSKYTVPEFEQLSMEIAVASTKYGARSILWEEVIDQESDHDRTKIKANFYS